MCLLLHCSDISNPLKPFHIHQRWTDKIMSEYFEQGDDEAKLGLPISPLMDRNKILVPQSQINFVNFIVLPAYSVLHDMFDLVTNEILVECKKQSAKKEKDDEQSKLFTAKGEKEELRPRYVDCKILRKILS